MDSEVIARVAASLAEDLGSGDVTAGLIPADQIAEAQIVFRTPGIVCGIPWATEAFRQVDPAVGVTWHLQDGDRIEANQVVGSFRVLARSLVTAERTVLNWLQCLSGTATTVADYVAVLQSVNAKTRLLDTRKTLPGLRAAQKYAVRCGGGYNHRMGLFDAYLIKENHIEACGSITKAVQKARALHPELLIEVEVETLAELSEALAIGVPRIMLDNFTPEVAREAVVVTAGRAELEISGGITRETLPLWGSVGVDYLSIGALTKDVKAADLSFQLRRLVKD